MTITQRTTHTTTPCIRTTPTHDARTSRTFFTVALDIIKKVSRYGNLWKKPARPIKKKENLFSRLPTEIVLLIFSFLSPDDLLKCSEVNKTWRQLADEKSLWENFPLQEIDESDWKRHANFPEISFEGLRPLNRRAAIIKMNRLASSQKNWCLLTLPKNFSLQIASRLEQCPVVINKDSIDWNPILRNFGQDTIEKPYRILISTQILHGSTKLPLEKQVKWCKKTKMALPNILEVIALLILHHKKFGTYLFSSESYTRCCNQTEQNTLIAGNFAGEGYYLWLEDKKKKHEDLGIAGVIRDI